MFKKNFHQVNKAPKKYLENIVKNNKILFKILIILKKKIHQENNHLKILIILKKKIHQENNRLKILILFKKKIHRWNKAPAIKIHNQKI